MSHRVKEKVSYTRGRVNDHNLHFGGNYPFNDYILLHKAIV